MALISVRMALLIVEIALIRVGMAQIRVKTPYSALIWRKSALIGVEREVKCAYLPGSVADGMNEGVEDRTSVKALRCPCLGLGLTVRVTVRWGWG